MSNLCDPDFYMGAEYIQKRLKIKTYGEQVMLTPEVFMHEHALSGIADQFAHHIVAGWRLNVPYNYLAKWMKPKDWWQAVRERWAPKWWLKRHPVQYEDLELGQVLNDAIPRNSGDSYFVLTRKDGSMVYPHDPPRHTFCPFCREIVPVIEEGPFA